MPITKLVYPEYEQPQVQTSWTMSDIRQVIPAGTELSLGDIMEIMRNLVEHYENGNDYITWDTVKCEVDDYLRMQNECQQ